MKNNNLTYLTDLIRKHNELTKEINGHLNYLKYKAERTCKFYDYDDGAHELICRADYEGLFGHENCLDCDDYEPKEKVK